MTPATRRTIATRAELAALSLRRLAASLDHAAPVLATPRARGIVEADAARASKARSSPRRRRRFLEHPLAERARARGSSRERAAGRGAPTPTPKRDSSRG